MGAFYGRTGLAGNFWVAGQRKPAAEHKIRVRRMGIWSRAAALGGNLTAGWTFRALIEGFFEILGVAVVWYVAGCLGGRVVIA